MKNCKGETKMKQLMKRFLCMALTLCLMTCFLPQQADASTVKYVTKVSSLKSGTAVTAKGYTSSYSSSTEVFTYTSQFYKISVPSGGYVTFHTTDASKDLYLYKSIKKNKAYHESNEIGFMYNKKTYYRVLPAGTYYVFASKGLRFKWVFHKATNSTNYCKSKATGLKAGKKATSVFFRGYEFNKWYKITVSSKKALSVNLTDLVSSGTVYLDVLTSSGMRVNTTSVNDTTWRTKSAVNKGTYYLRLRPLDYSSTTDYYRGRMCTLLWK